MTNFKTTNKQKKCQKHIFGLFLSKSDMLNQNKGVISAQGFDDTSELSDNRKFRTIKNIVRSKILYPLDFRRVKVFGL